MTQHNYKAPIDTVIIPVAGLGKRMGENTKAVPKALLPMGDKPLIMHAIDEAVASGVTDIILLCRPEHKELFDKQFPGHDTPQFMERYGHTVSVFSDPTAGGGPALCIAHFLDQAEREIGAFGVILPDDLIISSTPALKMLMPAFESTASTTIGARQTQLEHEKAHNATFVHVVARPDGSFITETVQIKPVEDTPISEHATCGRYIFDADFLANFQECHKGDGSEISMSALVRHYAETEGGGVNVVPINGDTKFLDCGDPDSYARAQAHFIPMHILREVFEKANLREPPDNKPTYPEHEHTG
mgnify:CR=1 FL=1